MKYHFGNLTNSLNGRPCQLTNVAMSDKASGKVESTIGGAKDKLREATDKD
jgi:hypothetical protein